MIIVYVGFFFLHYTDNIVFNIKTISSVRYTSKIVYRKMLATRCIEYNNIDFASFFLIFLLKM